MEPDEVPERKSAYPVANRCLNALFALIALLFISPFKVVVRLAVKRGYGRSKPFDRRRKGADATSMPMGEEECRLRALRTVARLKRLWDRFGLIVDSYGREKYLRPALSQHIADCYADLMRSKTRGEQDRRVVLYTLSALLIACDCSRLMIMRRLAGGYRVRGPEPRRMTLVDLMAIIAGFALVWSIPSRMSGWPLFLAPPPLLYLALIGSLRLTVGAGSVLALVVLLRRGLYGGAGRPAEWLALGLASLALLDLVPNLDEAVNAYYAMAGSNALDFGVARWLLSAPAAAGVVLVVAGLVPLRRRARDGSRVASALMVVGILGGLSLWFWGPCEVARLELPYLLVPSPQEDQSSWDWRSPVVLALREMVANGPVALTWGFLAAAAVRAWRTGRHGRNQEWAWTDQAVFADAMVAALLLLLWGVAQNPDHLVRLVSLVIITGLVSWWITGRLGIGRDPASSPWSFAR